MKVLVVEDEKRMADALAEMLRRHNYDVDVSYDGEAGLDNAWTGVYDVILLDILMPKADGLSVLRELRGGGIHTPVIFLTALSEVADRVKGLDLGADDYLPKPFKTEELVARIRAVTRRGGAFHADGLLAFGDIELNPLALSVRCGGESYALTQKETRLLEYLMGNTNIRLSANAIIEKVWGYDSEAEDGNVQAYVSFLRKKLAALGSRVRIGNLRGAGYMLEYDEVGDSDGRGGEGIGEGGESGESGGGPSCGRAAKRGGGPC